MGQCLEGAGQVIDIYISIVRHISKYSVSASVCQLWTWASPIVLVPLITDTHDMKAHLFAYGTLEIPAVMYAVTGQHHRSNLLILITPDGDIQKFAPHLRDNCITLVRTVETDQSNAILYFKND